MGEAGGGRAEGAAGGGDFVIRGRGIERAPDRGGVSGGGDGVDGNGGGDDSAVGEDRRATEAESERSVGFHSAAAEDGGFDVDGLHAAGGAGGDGRACGL